LNVPTRKYVDYFVARVQALVQAGVIPVLVFDGDKLPAKQEEETRRNTTRMRCLLNASQFMQEGKKTEADRLFAQAVDVTPQLAHAVQCAIYDLGIDILVAPYEADAQLTFLARNGHVDAVISEDSDLLVYGCPEVLFKYNSASGTCDRILGRDLASCMSLPSDADADFLKHVAVLTGCDYCPGVSGIGIKKSVEALKTYGGGYVGAVNALRAQGRVITDDDVHRMKLGILTFKHQIVYNPATRRLQHLDSLPAGAAQYDTSFLGRMYENINAVAVANGCADPITKLPFHAPVAESTFYLSLAAAVAGYAGDATALFNVWAVITQFSPPCKTKGSDMQVGLMLLDASSPQSVCANLFIKVTPVPPFSHFSLMQCASSRVISG
jgi:exonuclease-1